VHIATANLMSTLTGPDVMKPWLLLAAAPAWPASPTQQSGQCQPLVSAEETQSPLHAEELQYPGKVPVQSQYHPAAVAGVGSHAEE
jgi:hypothetical protein